MSLIHSDERVVLDNQIKRTLEVNTSILRSSVSIITTNRAQLSKEDSSLIFLPQGIKIFVVEDDGDLSLDEYLIIITFEVSGWLGRKKTVHIIVLKKLPRPYLNDVNINGVVAKITNNN